MMKKCGTIFLLISFFTLVCNAFGTELISYYSFDNSTALNSDDSINENNLQTNKAADPNVITNGAVGGAAGFDGATQGYDIKLSETNPSLYPAGSFTVSTWVRPETVDTSAYHAIVRDSSGGGYAMLIDNGTYRPYLYAVGSTQGVNSGVTAEVGVWSHLVMTYEATSGPDADGNYTGDMKFYVNGVETCSAVAAKYCPTSAFRFGLGCRGNGSWFFNGVIDEFAVFSGVLSASEIDYLVSKQATPLNVVGYTEPTNLPIAYYSFDDPNDLLGRDNSLNTNDLLNNLTAEPGDVAGLGGEGYAAYFDGTTGLDIKVGETTPCIYPSGAFTVSIWAKPTDQSYIDANQYIAMLRDGKTGGYAIYIQGGEWYSYIYAPGAYQDLDSNISVAVDQWQHIAIKFVPQSEPDAEGIITGLASLYVNGAMSASKTVQYDPVNTFRLGLGFRPTRDFYKGAVDDFAVFDFALTDDQISGLAMGLFDPMNLQTVVADVFGDLNGDGVVNYFDFAVIAENWLKSSY